MIEILNEDKRIGERRSDWHTPQDCFKLLDVQNAMDAINQRLDDGSARMTRIEDSICNLDKKLDGNNSDTSELLSIISNAKGFFKVIGFIMKSIGWLAGIIAPVVGLYFVLRDGIK